MAKQEVENGAPASNAHLCRSCRNGQFTVGYRESDVLVVCTNANPARLVPFPVRGCTDYWDRNRPEYEEMTKLALNFNETRRRPVRGFSPAGFAAGSEGVEVGPAEKNAEEGEVEPAFAG
jgi:hypothetical protein